MMYVPPKYINILMGHGLTQRQLIDELLAQVEAGSIKADLEALVSWCLYASTASTISDKNEDPAAQHIKPSRRRYAHNCQHYLHQLLFPPHAHWTYQDHR